MLAISHMSVTDVTHTVCVYTSASCSPCCVFRRYRVMSVCLNGENLQRTLL